jgi:putative endonuclease
LDINQAIRLEKQIKGWNREKKQALIDGDFDLVIKLSNKKSYQVK